VIAHTPPIISGSAHEELASPAVGVVLPVFNGAPTIAAAIRSIQQQTYTNWRLYVVNDRSTDDTAALVQRAADDDSRIQMVECPERRGLPYVLNLGWKATTESLVARADADDVCLPERFARQVEFLMSHPTVDVLGTGVELARDDGSDAGVHRRPADHAELMKKLFRECPFMHPSVMMRRSFLEATGGYDETLRAAEDYDLWLRGAHRHTYANLQELLVRYTVSGNSFSTRWAHTVGASRLILHHGAQHGRLLEGLFYSARYLAAGVSTRLRLRRRRL